MFSKSTIPNQQYTLSLWIRSDNPGMIRVHGHEFNTSTEWRRAQLVFVASEENVNVFFPVTGTYYLYHSKLEVGNKATGWSPSPFDYTRTEDLADVALSGKYDDLLDKPSIPQSVKELDLEGTVLYKGDITQESKEDSQGNKYLETKVPLGNGEYITYATYDADEYVVFGELGEDSEGKDYFCLDKKGLLTARNAVIYGEIHATSGVFRGEIFASSGEFAGKVEANSGTVGPFTINKSRGIESSHFYDALAIGVDVNYYGRVAPYTATPYRDSGLAMMKYTYKAGDPDEGWEYETTSMIGAVEDTGKKIFSTLIYNSLGGYVLIDEGVTCNMLDVLGSFSCDGSANINGNTFEDDRVSFTVHNPQAGNGMHLAPICSGVIASATIKPGEYRDVTVEFPFHFAGIPNVVACLHSSSTSSESGKLSVAVIDRNTTSASIRVFNGGTGDRAPALFWIATQN